MIDILWQVDAFRYIVYAIVVIAVFPAAFIVIDLASDKIAEIILKISGVEK